MLFGQVLRTNTSAPRRIPNLLVEITSPWRALEGVNSYAGIVSGDTVLPVVWGWGGWRQKMKGH